MQGKRDNAGEKDVATAQDAAGQGDGASGQDDAARRKYRQMTQSPVHRLVLSLAAVHRVQPGDHALQPCGHLLHRADIDSASGAIGVAFVVMTPIQAAGFYFGQGIKGTPCRATGRRDQRMADTMASIGVVSAFCMGLAIAVGHLLLEPICILAGLIATHPAVRQDLWGSS